MIITGKKIVVTGAASGIGRSLIEQLAEVDCVVLAVDHNLAELTEVCESVRGRAGNVRLFSCELADPQQVDALFEKAIEIIGED